MFGRCGDLLGVVPASCTTIRARHVRSLEGIQRAERSYFKAILHVSRTLRPIETWCPKADLARWAFDLGCRGSSGEQLCRSGRTLEAQRVTCDKTELLGPWQVQENKVFKREIAAARAALLNEAAEAARAG